MKGEFTVTLPCKGTKGSDCGFKRVERSPSSGKGDNNDIYKQRFPTYYLSSFSLDVFQNSELGI
jgi:hypothetical protein